MDVKERTIKTNDVDLFVSEVGDSGPPVVLLHGLGGSSHELLPTAKGLADQFRVILIDQRGHGMSSRRPGDLSRGAFVSDAVAVIERFSLNEKTRLVGHSMGAHTAFLTAHRRPDLVDRLVVLEGHAAGSKTPDEAKKVGSYFESWPLPFVNESAARKFLGDSPLAQAWIDDLEQVPGGLRPRFDSDIMETTIRAVHEPRWAEWEALTVPTLAVFTEKGMFTAEAKDALIQRRPETERADLAGASHDAHLDSFDTWIRVIREYLNRRLP